ncbi:unnamed protein product [Diamesa tonsa]
MDPPSIPINYDFDEAFDMHDGMLLLEEDEGGMSFDPYDFINEDFIKCEPEQRQEESNYANFLQTPPISPQSNSNCSTIINTNNKYPCNYQAFQLIPVAKIKEEQKFKVIQPKPEKRSSTSLSSDSDSTTNSNVPLKILGNTNIDEKAIKKHQRLIRNRESAIQSRKKKKALLETLEVENNELKSENQYLKVENNQLKEKLQKYNQFTCHCTSSFTNRLPSKNSTVLLAVFFMVGFNIFMMPIGNIFNPSSSLTNHLTVENGDHHSRNLLFVDQNVTTTNTTTEVSTPEPQPIYLNQTENIRKTNIENIRRWIRQPDFNTSLQAEEFKFNDNLIEDKLIKMYELSRDKTQKYTKNKKRIPKKKIPVTAPAPIQLYNPKSKLIQLNEFFEEINRQDDVFYVFSFKSDHMLLPAINSYNFSQIKMNLMMPARINGSSSSETIRMMQIETIIVNTSIVEIKEKSIPDNFRSTNSSTQCNVPHKTSVTNQTKPEKIMKTLVQTDFANRTDKFKNNFFINNFDILQKNSKNNVVN